MKKKNFNIRILKYLLNTITSYSVRKRTSVRDVHECLHITCTF